MTKTIERQYVKVPWERIEAIVDAASRIDHNRIWYNQKPPTFSAFLQAWLGDVYQMETITEEETTEG